MDDAAVELPPACRTTCRARPGSRSPPGWSWTAARCRRWTATSGSAPPTTGPARRSPPPGGPDRDARPDPLQLRPDGPGRRLEGPGPLGPGRGRLCRGHPGPAAQPVDPAGPRPLSVERDDRARRRRPSPAVALMPDNFDILDTLSVTRLWSGDRAGYRAAIAAMLDRLERSAAPELVHAVAWRCCWGPRRPPISGSPFAWPTGRSGGLPHDEQGSHRGYTRGGPLTAPAGSTRRSTGSRKPSDSRAERPIPRIPRSWRWPIVAWAPCGGRAPARPAARPSAERGPDPVLERAGVPPAVRRGRGGGPPGPGVPGRSVLARPT